MDLSSDKKINFLQLIQLIQCPPEYSVANNLMVINIK